VKTVTWVAICNKVCYYCNVFSPFSEVVKSYTR